MIKTENLNRKEVHIMPSLKHLIEELTELSVDPGEIRLPGALYDELLDQAESEADEDEQE